MQQSIPKSRKDRGPVHFLSGRYHKAALPDSIEAVLERINARRLIKNPPEGRKLR